MSIGVPVYTYTQSESTSGFQQGRAFPPRGEDHTAARSHCQNWRIAAAWVLRTDMGGANPWLSGCRCHCRSLPREVGLPRCSREFPDNRQDDAVTDRLGCRMGFLPGRSRHQASRNRSQEPRDHVVGQQQPPLRQPHPIIAALHQPNRRHLVNHMTISLVQANPVPLLEGF